MIEIVEERPSFWSIFRIYLSRHFFFGSKNIYLERDFHYSENVNKKPTKKLYFGYFQSPKYFQECFEELRECLVIRNPSKGYEALLNEFETQNVLVLHIRRGDYLQKQNFHGLASESYFRKAINLLTSLDLNMKLAVFSEDREYAEKLFPDAWKIVTPAEIECPVETLLLMSRYSKFIGSNSSFSWWKKLDRRCLFPTTVVQGEAMKRSGLAMRILGDSWQ